MRAIDTNVLVRYFVGDDPEQAIRARRTLDAGDVFVPITVVLEFDWVMRSAYKRSSAAIANAFAVLGGMRGVTIENAPVLAKAIDLVGAGMDFADALHAASAIERGCEAFVTFDARLRDVLEYAEFEIIALSP